MPSFSLDIGSLSVVLTGVCTILSVVMVLIWNARRTYHGFGFWTAGNAAYAVRPAVFALHVRLSA